MRADMEGGDGTRGGRTGRPFGAPKLALCW
jgi:hypothetical protein